MPIKRYVTGVGWCWLEDGEIVEVTSSVEEAICDPQSATCRADVVEHRATPKGVQKCPQ